MIRVIGSPRDYDGRRHLLVFDCSEVEDFNEFTHHILDVIYNHLQRNGAIKNAVSSTSSMMQVRLRYRFRISNYSKQLFLFRLRPLVRVECSPNKDLALV